MRVEIVLLGLLMSGGATAQGESGEEPDVPLGPETVPSLELLEFLGTFRDEDGLWFDPLLLDEQDDPHPVLPERDGGEGVLADEASDD